MPPCFLKTKVIKSVSDFLFSDQEFKILKNKPSSTASFVSLNANAPSVSLAVPQSRDNSILLMRYCQLVLGPAGAGKSRYCSLMSDSAAIAQKRTIHVANLDPAAEHFDYEPILDIRELIQVRRLFGTSKSEAPSKSS